MQLYKYLCVIHTSVWCRTWRGHIRTSSAQILQFSLNDAGSSHASAPMDQNEEQCRPWAGTTDTAITTLCPKSDACISAVQKHTDGSTSEHIYSYGTVVLSVTETKTVRNDRNKTRATSKPKDTVGAAVQKSGGSLKCRILEWFFHRSICFMFSLDPDPPFILDVLSTSFCTALSSQTHWSYLDGLRRESMLLEDFVEPWKTQE